jgi:RNA polymerase sigma factor (sigma-70 family)
MKIDNDLIIQWEPKIQKMLSGVFITGMERDDIAQELRIAIVRAATAYDEERGILFHTYLHTTMVNMIRTLMSKAKRRPDVRSIDISNAETEYLSEEIMEALTDPTDYLSAVEVNAWVEAQGLNLKEHMFLKLKLDGLSMDEITEDLGESAYKIRESMREKFIDIANEYIFS